MCNVAGFAHFWHFIAEAARQGLRWGMRHCILTGGGILSSKPAGRGSWGGRAISADPAASESGREPVRPGRCHHADRSATEREESAVEVLEARQEHVPG